MRKLLVIFTFVVLALHVQLAQANNIALNDTLSIDSFVDAFNKSKDAADLNVSISKRETKFDDETNRYITLYSTNLGDFFIMQSTPSGNLQALGIWVNLKTDNNGSVINFEDTQKNLVLQMMLAERVLGMPSGEGAVNGMFAILDAIKKGKGSYWSNVTNRRYIIEPTSSKEAGAIGLIIYADI